MDSKERKKSILTLFLLFFPSLLIAVIPSEISGSIWLPIVIKGLFAFYQFVAIKNFIDVHYGY